MLIVLVWLESSLSPILVLHILPHLQLPEIFELVQDLRFRLFVYCRCHNLRQLWTFAVQHESIKPSLPSDPIVFQSSHERLVFPLSPLYVHLHTEKPHLHRLRSCMHTASPSLTLYSSSWRRCWASFHIVTPSFVWSVPPLLSTLLTSSLIPLGRPTPSLTPMCLVFFISTTGTQWSISCTIFFLFFQCHQPMGSYGQSHHHLHISLSADDGHPSPLPDARFPRTSDRFHLHSISNSRCGSSTGVLCISFSKRTLIRITSKPAKCSIITSPPLLLDEFLLFVCDSFFWLTPLVRIYSMISGFIKQLYASMTRRP